MCFVQDGDKELLIVFGLGEGLSTYNTDTDKLEWKVHEAPDRRLGLTGVTTDGRGHLFVTDYDSDCVVKHVGNFKFVLSRQDKFVILQSILNLS